MIYVRLTSSSGNLDAEFLLLEVLRTQLREPWTAAYDPKRTFVGRPILANHISHFGSRSTIEQSTAFGFYGALPMSRANQLWQPPSKTTGLRTFAFKYRCTAKER